MKFLDPIHHKDYKTFERYLTEFVICVLGYFVWYGFFYYAYNYLNKNGDELGALIGMLTGIALAILALISIVVLLLISLYYLRWICLEIFNLLCWVFKCIFQMKIEPYYTWANKRVYEQNAVERDYIETEAEKKRRRLIRDDYIKKLPPEKLAEYRQAYNDIYKIAYSNGKKHGEKIGHSDGYDGDKKRY